MIKKFTKLQVDYMYELLEYIVNTYKLRFIDNITLYQWNEKYKYYQIFYLKSQRQSTDIFEQNCNIYHWMFYNSLYMSLKCLYIKKCLQSKINIMEDIQTDYQDINFIHFVNNILTECEAKF